MSTNDMSNLLNRPHISAMGGATNAIPPDPAVKTRIRVTLDNLVPFHDNPRQSRNPNYEEIKESIRNAGLLNAPNVTRKSPDQQYMIRDGGNTRLEILNELWSETGDRRYFEFDCDFYPYQDELTMLLQHCIENEMRGGMILIERGMGASKAKQQLELTEGPLSNVALAKKLKTLGWSINDRSLGIALYAVEKLLPTIPIALWEGLGIDSVSKLRKIIDDCGTYWVSLATLAAKDEAEIEFEDIWQSVFAALDSEYFDVETARDNLEAEIAERIECPLMSVRGEIQMISKGLSQGGNKPTSLLTGRVDSGLPAAPATSAPPRPSSAPLQPATSILGSGGARANESAPAPMAAKSHLGRGEQPAYEAPEYKQEFPGNNYHDHDEEGAQDVVSQIQQPQAPSQPLATGNPYQYTPTAQLQGRAYELAKQLAEHYWFSDLLIDPNAIGYDQFHMGFLIDRPSTAQHNADMAFEAGKLSGLYQHLYFLSALPATIKPNLMNKWMQTDWFNDWKSPERSDVRTLKFWVDRLLITARPFSSTGESSDESIAIEAITLRLLRELEPIIGELSQRC